MDTRKFPSHGISIGNEEIKEMKLRNESMAQMYLDLPQKLSCNENPL